MKQAIGTSPFELVYGTEAVFPVQLGIPVMKFLQNSQEEPDDMQRRIFEMIELHLQFGMLRLFIFCCFCNALITWIGRLLDL